MTVGVEKGGVDIVVWMEQGGIDGGDGGGKRLLLALLLFLILESVSTFLNLFNRFWLV